MQPPKRLVVLGLLLPVVVGGFLLANRHTSKEMAPKIAAQSARTLPARESTPLVGLEEVAAAAEPLAPLPSDPAETSPKPRRKSAPRTTPAAPAPPVKITASAIASAPPARRGKPPIQDPAARVALYFVGADPEAEEYWFAAINDPSLPASERQDLIEDLNEDGLPDPKHPTPDDLPLIVSRLHLIETVGMDPMDEVNAAAFMEAYKDLVNLAYVASGSGEPVR